MKSARRLLIDLPASLVCAALLVGAGSFAVDAERNATAAETLAELSRAHPDETRERALAEAYWSRYEDVRTSPTYGRSGRMGVYGARAHYLRFGRVEHRIWPAGATARGDKSN